MKDETVFAIILTQWAIFLALAGLTVAGAATMLLTMSMYRAGLFLMVSFVAAAGLFFVLGADLLGIIQVMMSVSGMLIMMAFMVMLMIDPGGEMMWDMKRQMRLPGLGALSMSMPRRPAPVPSSAPPDDVGAAQSDVARRSDALTSGASPEGTSYTCPMHPEVQMPTAGECPKCGMDLVPDERVSAQPAQESGDGMNTMTAMSPAAHYDMMVAMAMSTEQLPWALVAGLLTAILLGVLVIQTPWPTVPVSATADATSAVGELLLSRYMMAFEGAAMLILAGIAGAVILGRRERAPEPNQGTASAALPPAVQHTMLEETTMTHHDEKQSGKGEWTCPMHPEVRSPTPGACPKCGMELVPAESPKQRGNEGTRR